MPVTLYSGRYRFVCSCSKGHLYDPLDIFKKTKVETYCWYCKGNGKYIKVMEETLKFSTNWNNKLNCNSFTTLRLRNDNKYYKGAKVNVWLGNSYKGKATIIGVSFFTLEQINEFVARLDSGYPAEECRKIILQIYKNKPNINWATQQLAFCLIVYDGRAKQPDLFSNDSKE